MTQPSFKQFLSTLEEARSMNNCDFIKDPQLRKMCKKLSRGTKNNVTYGGWGYYGVGGHHSGKSNGGSMNGGNGGSMNGGTTGGDGGGTSGGTGGTTGGGAAGGGTSGGGA